MKELVLDVRNLAHSYRKGTKSVDVFSQLNLQLRANEVAVVRGESGTGKTTLLLACGGMQRPLHGEILVDGIDLFSVSAAERNKIRSAKIGYLFQTLELVPYLNVLENLTLHDRSLASKAIHWLDKFELGDRISHRPDELSHGQRQRVALMRALVHQPDLLIADEPTGNLDDRNGQIVFEILRSYANSGGAVLIASHDSKTETIADEVLVLNDGKLVSQGTKTSHDSETAQV